METSWTQHWKHREGSFRRWFWRLIVKRAYKNLLKNIDLENPKILELGSGSGINSLTIAEVLNAKNLTLVDFNQKALEISKKFIENSNLNLDVKLLNKDVLNLNLNKKFDIVHSEGLIEHFYKENRLEAFKKHIDFCKKGGFIIIFVPYKSLKYNLFKWFCTQLNMWMWDEEPFSKKELYDLCNKFCLQILKKHTSLLMHEIGILVRK